MTLSYPKNFCYVLRLRGENVSTHWIQATSAALGPLSVFCCCWLLALNDKGAKVSALLIEPVFIYFILFCII